MARLSPGMQGLIIGIVIIAIIGGGATFFFLTADESLRCRVGPCAGYEALSLESYRINTPTNMTLTIVNTGVVPTSMVSYLVKPQSGQSYSNSSWSQPSFRPNDHMSVNIMIDGVGFTFQSGSSYTITIGTVRNKDYVFSITA